MISKDWSISLYKQTKRIIFNKNLNFEMKTMVFVSLLFVVCFCCPPTCNCTSKSLSCSVCLTQYYQYYNLNSSKCQCLKNFVSYIGLKYHCCPQICGKCYEKGCASCKEGAEIAWNNIDKFYDCICKQNYVRNGSDCICLSQTLPQQYYYNSFTQQCYKCPLGCNCSSIGCYQCQQSTNRTIYQININEIVCQCNGQLVDVDGVCSCFQNCICQDSIVVSCSSQSNRITSYGWKCKFPYVSVNNMCNCSDPYVLLPRNNIIQCVCASKKNYTEYYQINSQCFKCPPSCTCDTRGCVSCTSPLWQFDNFKCQCRSFLSKVNGECSCIQPYYFKQQSKDICGCLADLNSLVYKQINQGMCQLVCAIGCTCNELGCISCKQHTLREIKIQDDIYYCFCIKNATESNKQCFCDPSYYYDYASQSCKCRSQISYHLAYIQQKAGTCRLCPAFCKCNQKGCYYCEQIALRVILEKDQEFQCDCRNGVFPINEQCKCIKGAQFNFILGKCECVDPYVQYKSIFDDSLFCECKDNYDPTNYYTGLNSTCSKCPIGCTCSSYGCFDCDHLTLRFILTVLVNQQNTFSICPCLQNYYQIDGVCTNCTTGEYFNGKGCTPCPDCQTCHRYGCSSCRQNMTLVGYKCECNNKNLTNIEGNCICQTGKYLNSFMGSNQSFVCQSCPKNCQTCTVINNLIQCTSCNTNQTFRDNVPEDNCPCSPGYTQAPITMIYCCSNRCQDCNQKQCLSCPIFTFRTIHLGDCVCMEPFVDIGQVACVCAQSFYYFNQSCFKCPLRCPNCSYNQTTKSPNCDVCSRDNNRNTSSLQCSCLPGFAQTSPPSDYCYPKYCQFNQLHCTKCQNGRVLDEIGSCVCPLGQYQFVQKCLPCALPGCLKCQSSRTCSWCDQEKGYYIVGTTCINSTIKSFIMTQTKDTGIMLLIDLHKMITRYQTIPSIVGVSLNQIQKPNSTIFLPSIRITEEVWQVQIIFVIFINVTDVELELSNVIFSLLLNYKQQDQKIHQINVKIDKIVSKRSLQKIDESNYIAIQVFVILFLAFELVINMMGYKHNQTAFYIQTLSFSGFYLKEIRLEIMQFLFSLRASYFQFDGGVFHKMVPEQYLESSEGNFYLLTMDSNILRISDIPILLILIVLGLALIIRILYSYFVYSEISQVKYHQHKKMLYRFLEYVFKVFMYPIVFFSLVTLFNIHSTVYLQISFKYICIGISGACLFFFITFVAFLYYFGKMSKLFTVQLICQLIIGIVSSVLIIITFQYKILPIFMFVLIVIIKNLSFYFLYKKLIEEKYQVLNLQILLIPLQIVPIVTIYFNLEYLAITFTFAAVVSQIIIEFVIIKVINRQLYFDKIKLNMREEVTSSGVILP